MLNSILYLIFAYLLGSFPTGYLITRFSTGKNILEMGWRKTSGSNVYRSVGTWQAAVTGILDIIKGFLAVWIARKLGFSPEIQALSGVAAILGHNWSLFLKFAGGRGIATYFGAMIALSSKIFGFSLIPFAILGLSGNAAIGTFFLLGTTIFLSALFAQFNLVGIFAILSLILILIKRLSPVKEIFPLKEKKALIKNRLLFDNDQPVRFRIRNPFKK